MKQRLFITATGTGIGKSFITASLARQAKAHGRTVAAYKPIISGFDLTTAAESDTGLLLQSLDTPLTPENIVHLSPWRFAAPFAPSMSARREQRSLDFNAVVAHSQTVMKGSEDVVLIEGVGGVMVPLDNRHTVLDWIEAISIEALLITGSYLGSISHTLTALTVLHQRQIPIHSLIINESENSSVSLSEMIDELTRWTCLPIIPVKRRASSEGWRDITELYGLIT